MKYFLISFFFLSASCVGNPYHEPQVTVEKEAQKNPDQAENIRQYHSDWENRKRLNPGPSDAYSVTQEKVSGFAVGGENAAVHIGNNTYEYHHKINLTLICGKDSFPQKTYSKKNIKWKLTNAIEGEEQTSLDGKLHIYVKTDSDQRFTNLHLSTNNRSYEVRLNESPLVELEKSDCL